jgi:NADH:ubiquinone oxidoreductase subunit 6 (subunit J)
LAAYLFGGVLILTLPLAAVVALPIAVSVSQRGPVNWQSMSPHLPFCSLVAGVVTLLLAILIAMFGARPRSRAMEKDHAKQE